MQQNDSTVRQSLTEKTQIEKPHGKIDQSSTNGTLSEIQFGTESKIR